MHVALLNLRVDVGPAPASARHLYGLLCYGMKDDIPRPTETSIVWASNLVCEIGASLFGSVIDPKIPFVCFGRMVFGREAYHSFIARLAASLSDLYFLL